MSSQSVQNKINNSKRLWTSKSLAPAFWHKLFYATIRIAGRNTAYILLFFAVCFYCMVPNIRKRGEYYLRRRFACRNTLQLLAHTFRLYWNFGQMLVDRSVLRILGKFKATGTEEDENALRELYSRHNRLILLTAHVGCWQMGFSYLNFLDAPKSVVMLMERGNVDKHSFKWKSYDSSKGGKTSDEISIIDPASPMGGTLEMLNALNNNSVLCINADRTFGSIRHTVEVDFLGGKIRLPISAYKIAASTGTPIAIVFSERTGAGEARFRLSKVMHIPQDTGKGEIRGAQAFTPFAQTYAKEIEKYCESHPYQFYNFFNMWQ